MTTSADARRFVRDHKLSEHIAKLVEEAPPLPSHTAELWRRALVDQVRDSRECPRSAVSNRKAIGLPHGATYRQDDARSFETPVPTA